MNGLPVLDFMPEEIYNARACAQQESEPSRPMLKATASNLKSKGKKRHGKK